MDFVSNCSYKNDVPVLSRQRIEDIANNVLKATRPSFLQEISPVPIDKILENDFELNVVPATLTVDQDVLGQMYFVDVVDEFLKHDGIEYYVTKEPVQRKTVIFDQFMFDNQEERFRFTAAHELGHWIMHQKFYSQGHAKAFRTNCTQYSVFRQFPTRQPIEWTEWQANQFASCILLPRETVRPFVKQFLDQNDTRWQKMLDFNIAQMRGLFVQLSVELAKKFNVSKECAFIRLQVLFNVKYPSKS